MRRLLMSLTLSLLALIPGLALAGGPGSWPQSGHDAHHSNNSTEERLISSTTVATLHPTWTYTVRGASQTIATGSRVYTLVPSGTSANLLVLSARTGRLLRRLSAPQLHLAAGDTPTTLAYVRSQLIVGGGRNSLVALDGSTLRFHWRAQASALFLVASGGVLYTGKYCQDIPSSCGVPASYAIDARTGRILWRHPGNRGGPPVLAAGHLYQSWSDAGGTRVYDPKTGALLATLSITPAWTGEDSAAYAYMDDPRINSRTWLGKIGPDGKPVWKTNLGRISPLISGPALTSGTMFVPSDRFHPGVVAVNTANGHIRWGANTGEVESLAAANGLVFVLEAGNGRVDILTAGNGKVVRQIATPTALHVAGPMPVQSMLIANGTLYEAGQKAIVALRP